MTSPERPSRDQATPADIGRAGRLAHQFIQGLDRESFPIDEKTQAAVLHEITIIGEAVKRLSDDFRAANPAMSSPLSRNPKPSPQHPPFLHPLACTQERGRGAVGIKGPHPRSELQRARLGWARHNRRYEVVAYLEALQP